MKKLLLILKSNIVKFVYISVFLFFLLLDIIRIKPKQYKQKKTRKIIWFGAYGNSNIGDDLIFFAIKKFIPKEYNIELSSRSKVNNTNYGVKTFFIGNLFSFINYYKKIKEADLVILGGGGLFEYYENSFSKAILNLFFYLFPLLIAKLLNKDYIIVGIGCNEEKIPNYLLKTSFRYIMNNAKLIITRDKKSMIGFKNNGVLNKKLIWTYDPVFGNELKLQDYKKAEPTTIGFLIWPYFLWPYFHKYENISKMTLLSKNQLISHEIFIKELLILINKLENKSYNLIFPVFHESDKLLLNELCVNYNEKIQQDNYYDDIQKCDVIVTMRYHGQITSLSRNIPIISIPVQEKMSALIENFQLENYMILPQKFTAGNYEEIIELILKEKDILKEKLFIKYQNSYALVNELYTKEFKSLFCNY